MSLVSNLVKFHDCSIVWEIAVQFFGPKYNPLVFDAFYLHKYSHYFSELIWLIILFFFEKHQF